MNLNEIYNDYFNKFAGKKANVFLNYSKIPFVCVCFELNNLPHVLGLHKVTKLPNKVLIEQIRREVFTIKTFKNSDKYKEVINRIENYEFLKDVFYRNFVDVCIVRKDLGYNSMNLDIVFFKENNRDVVVLGLRRDSKSSLYYPTTLHTDFSKKYKQYRKTKINSIEWID